MHELRNCNSSISELLRQVNGYFVFCTVKAKQENKK